MKKTLMFLALVAIMTVRPTCGQTIAHTPKGVSYSLLPKRITAHVTAGTGRSVVTMKIVTDDLLYGFTVQIKDSTHATPIPTYGCLPLEKSGGAQGTHTITWVVNGRYFKTGTYEGIILVHIFHGSESAREGEFLRVPIKIIASQ